MIIKVKAKPKSKVEYVKEEEERPDYIFERPEDVKELIHRFKPA